MDRSISNVRMFSAYLANHGVAKAVPRRGYVAEAAAASTAAKGRSSGAVKTRHVTKEETTWMPDPKTGCFMPGNRRDEIDAAELRAAMLKGKDLDAAEQQ